MLYPLTHRGKIMACVVNFYILNGKYYIHKIIHLQRVTARMLMNKIKCTFYGIIIYNITPILNNLKHYGFGFWENIILFTLFPCWCLTICFVTIIIIIMYMSSLSVFVWVCFTSVASLCCSPGPRVLSRLLGWCCWSDDALSPHRKGIESLVQKKLINNHF